MPINFNDFDFSFDSSSDARMNQGDHIYDAIIIGSGMGGLNCAAKLALNGKKVIVLEKNGFIGGRCASYKKDGYTVDYGVHAFSLGSQGPLNTLPSIAKKRFGIDFLKWKTLSPAILYKNSFIRSYMPLDIFHPFNLIKTGLSFLKFKDASLKDKKLFLKFNAAAKKMKSAEISQYGNLSVKDFIDKYATEVVSRFLHIMVAISSDSYAVVPYNQVSARDFIEVYQQTMNSRGVGYPVGGAGAIANALGDIIEKCGGQILISAPVNKIIIENKGGKPAATGVEVTNKGKKITIFAKNIISNINWKDFIAKSYIDNSLIPEELSSKINNTDHSFSSFVAHIAFDQPVINEKFVMKAALLTPEEIFVKREAGEFPRDVGCFMPIVSNIDPKLAPKGEQLALAGIGVSEDMADQKEFFKDLILDNLQNLCDLTGAGKKSGFKIDIRDHIKWIDFLGPAELANLFGEHGSIVGIAQKIGQVRESRLPIKAPIDKLYFCGDDSGKGLFGVGTELASLSGQKCADLILHEK